eukprot:6195891-Pleurochrysis_carterae.AAC.1
MPRRRFFFSEGGLASDNGDLATTFPGVLPMLAEPGCSLFARRFDFERSGDIASKLQALTCSNTGSEDIQNSLNYLLFMGCEEFSEQPRKNQQLCTMNLGWDRPNAWWGGRFA